MNPTKAKHLQHALVRRGQGHPAHPADQLFIERAIEYIANDELVEVTPNHLRFRKRILDANDRRKAIKRAKDIAAATA